MAIVGAGLSGTLVAVQLLLQAQAPIRITLCERRRPFGKGLAYSTRCGSHRLNVPAGKMSALPGDNGHFLRWLRARDPEAAAHDFVPRSLYGEYLAWLLDETEKTSPALLDRREVEVSELSQERREGPLLLRFADGTNLEADEVVLAMGNFDPADPPGLSPSLLENGRYLRDPWSEQAVRGLAPEAPVLLIGSGLTAVDVALSLRDAGHRGPIHAVSRHGLLPQRHAPTIPWTLGFDAEEAPCTARGLLALVRGEIARADGNWRPVIDALRPLTQAIWGRLPRAERRRFLRHLRAYWEVHRHRMAPEVAAAIEGMAATGQFEVRAARIESLRPSNGGVLVKLRPRGSRRTEELRVDRVLNCTSPNANLRRERDPFVSYLWAAGWIRPDPLGLGLSTAADGAVLDAICRPAERLWAVGPLRRGDLWESSAAPEIRVQAEGLATTLLEKLRVVEEFSPYFRTPSFTV